MMEWCAYGRRNDQTAIPCLAPRWGCAEALADRSQQRFFDISEESIGFGYPDAPDVDFNKRAEVDCTGRESRDVNLRSVP